VKRLLGFILLTLSASSAQAQLVIPVLGPQKVLFVPITYSGVKLFTTQQAQAELEVQNRRWKTWSYGLSSIDFTVADWVQVPAGGVECSQYLFGAAYANQVLSKRGYEVYSYRAVVYQTTNGQPCPFGNFTIGSTIYLTADGVAPPVLHELGHVFGFGHANGYDCGDAMIRPFDRFNLNTFNGQPNGCIFIGYKNPMDPMGEGGYFFDLPHQVMLGWVGLAGNGSPPLITATGPGTYRFGNLDDQDKTRPKGLRIARMKDGVQLGWLYFEHRGSPTERGVFITYENQGDDLANLLLDATPAGDYGDVELMVGQSITDPVAGITITNLASDLSGATLKIAVGDANTPDTFNQPRPPD